MPSTGSRTGGRRLFMGARVVKIEVITSNVPNFGHLFALFAFVDRNKSVVQRTFFFFFFFFFLPFTKHFPNITKSNNKGIIFTLFYSYSKKQETQECSVLKTIYSILICTLIFVFF